MKDLLEFIVKSLVENPDDVEVLEETKGGEINVKVLVNSADIGKVIGRGGKVANAIRVVVRTSATRLNKRVNVKFAEK